MGYFGTRVNSDTSCWIFWQRIVIGTSWPYIRIRITPKFSNDTESTKSRKFRISLEYAEGHAIMEIKKIVALSRIALQWSQKSCDVFMIFSSQKKLRTQNIHSVPITTFHRTITLYALHYHFHSFTSPLSCHRFLYKQSFRS